MIRKALSGFYYVHTEDGCVLECHAKGVFRKEGITPLVGDQVEVENGVVSRILPRKNQILRPPAANIDRAVLVVSSAKPQPNTLILDKLIAVCESKGIEPVLVFTKTDLADSGELQEVYRKAGFRVFTSGLGQMDHSELLSELSGRLSVFIGNSGVGKSTLMNELIPELDLATAHISDKLGRGRHTTRHVELYELEGGGLVADTPGFSTVEVERDGHMHEGGGPECVREFREFLGKCQFQNCSHRKEKGCAVLEALKEGKISPSRHESYVALYEDAMQIPDWELREGEKRN